MSPPRGVRALSIRVKLFMLISAVVGALVAFFAIYFASRQVALLERTVISKGEFLAQQVRTAIAFDDKETAREVFDAAHNSSEILYVALFRSDGRLLFADGGGDLVAPQRVTTARLETDGARMRVLAPVTSVEGPKGTLVVELDRARLQEEIRAVRLAALGIGAAGLMVGCLAAWLVGTSFARRIQRVKRRATEVAKGDLAQPPVEERHNDEIGEMADAFNTMVTSLRDLVLKLSETSAQLEGASESFLDLVRAHGDDMKDAARRVEDVIRAEAHGALRDTAIEVERLTQGARSFSDGLVPGFIELRQYADHLNGVIGGFKVVPDSNRAEVRS